MQRCFVLGALLSLASADSYAGFAQLTFHGIVVDGSSRSSNCIGLCGSNVPAVGSPIAFTVAFDTATAGAAESTAPYPGTRVRYDFVAPSSVDFGYRPDFLFTDFSIRVTDDMVGNSAPDQLQVFRNEPVGQRNIAWFNIELDSSSTTFLNGPGLPMTLDLALTHGGGDYFGLPHGTLSYIANGQFAEFSKFVITDIASGHALPTPSTHALTLAAFGICSWRVARRKQLSTPVKSTRQHLSA